MSWKGRLGLLFRKEEIIALKALAPLNCGFRANGFASGGPCLASTYCLLIQSLPRQSFEAGKMHTECPHPDLASY